jgi:hypothetical protein
MPYLLIGTAFSSVANLAIVPMQDQSLAGRFHPLTIDCSIFVRRNFPCRFKPSEMINTQDIKHF